jgi:hypothetical protein
MQIYKYKEELRKIEINKNIDNFVDQHNFQPMGYIITSKLKSISQINKIHTNDDQNSLEKEILFFIIII